jgi:hypothetical protein
MSPFGEMSPQFSGSQHARWPLRCLAGEGLCRSQKRIGRCARPAAQERRWSGGVWCDLDDEVGVEGGGDPFEQGDGRDDAACFQAGEGRLGHAGAGG